MIRFGCPRCSKRLKAPDDSIGRRTSCPRCGMRVVVPGQTGPETFQARPDPATIDPSDSAFIENFVNVGTCPSCGCIANVPESQVGRWTKCPACGAGFAASRDLPDRADSIEDSVPRFQSTPSRSSGSAAAGIAVFIFCLLTLLLMVMLIIFLPTDDKGQSRPAGQSTTRADPATGTGTGTGEITGRVAGQILSSVGSFVCLMTVLGILYFACLILILAWVARDARNRGLDGGAMWVFMVLIFQWIALLVYVASRPHGVLVVCRHCGNKRLTQAKTCPHCGRK